MSADSPIPPCGDCRFDDPLLRDGLRALLAEAVARQRPPGLEVRIGQARAAACDGRDGATAPAASAWRELVEVAGVRALQPAVEPLAADAVWDVASLTKPMVTAPLVLQLVEQGAWTLDTPLHDLLPAFTADAAAAQPVTLRHLLTHTAGLPAGLSAQPLQLPSWRGREAAVARACALALTDAPGAAFRYSDVGFILLGAVVERVAGRPLQALAAERLFAPLGLHDTGFLPLQHPAAGRVVPTAAAPPEPALRGVVHDPTARAMGGVAGHAGLFSTARDVARFARCILGGGALDGVRVLSAPSVAAMTGDGAPPAAGVRRGLGWDIDSPYARPRGRVWPVGSFGHTGFTGCALWIAPSARAYSVFLSARVHPAVGESIVDLYEAVGTAAGRLTG